MVASYKRKPFLSETDRLAVIKACKYVDDAFVIRQYDNKEYIEQYGINIIVHGDDWEVNSYMEQIRVTPDYIMNKKSIIIYLNYLKRAVQQNERVYIIYRKNKHKN